MDPFSSKQKNQIKMLRLKLQTRIIENIFETRFPSLSINVQIFTFK